MEYKIFQTIKKIEIIFHDNDGSNHHYMYFDLYKGISQYDNVSSLIVSSILDDKSNIFNENLRICIKKLVYEYCKANNIDKSTIDYDALTALIKKFFF